MGYLPLGLVKWRHRPATSYQHHSPQQRSLGGDAQADFGKIFMNKMTTEVCVGYLYFFKRGLARTSDIRSNFAFSDERSSSVITFSAKPSFSDEVVFQTQMSVSLPFLLTASLVRISALISDR